MIAKTPEPPYYAVIFTSKRTDNTAGYERTAKRMVELAAKQPGFLGIESVRDSDGFGITVSYWSNLDAIDSWKHQAEHMVAQKAGRDSWYRDYAIRVALVERCRFASSLL